MVGSTVFRIGLYFKRIRNILKTNINEYTGRCFWNMISEFISNIVTDQLGKCTPDRSSKLDKYKRDFGQSTLPAMSEKRNNRKHCQKAWLSKRLFGQNVQANDFLIVVSSYPFRYFDHRQKKIQTKLQQQQQTVWVAIFVKLFNSTSENGVKTKTRIIDISAIHHAKSNQC